MLVAVLGVALFVVLLGGGCVALLAVLGGFDVMSDCRDSDRTIIAAAARGERQVVARELRDGVDPDLVEDDETALTCAAAAGHAEVVSLLLDQGANPSVDALRTAVGARSTGLGVPAFAAPTVDAERDEIVGLLLDHGVDPDAGENGPSPLLFAAWSGQTSVVDLLMAHSADPNHGGRVDSFVILAASSGFGSTATTAGTVPLPRVRGEFVDNVPPLVGAAWGGHHEIATRLLDAGADPNLASDEAFTPIYAAAVRGDRPMVELLLARGASPTPTVRAGVLTPAEAARRAGFPEIADLLTAAPPVL